MKNVSLLPLFVIFVFSAHTSAAQNSILAGKILDENNNPIPQAEVKLCQLQSAKNYQAKTNDDGLYYTPALQSGNYVVEVSARNVVYRTELNLPPMEKSTRYHDLALKDSKVQVSVYDKNPFMQVTLAKMQKEIPTHDFLEESRFNADGIPSQNLHRIKIEKAEDK